MIKSKKLVLAGGGHSHAIVLRQWGLNPLAGVDLILITNVTQTPYSGMLPGYLAGFYTFAETHIDLLALAKFAQARIILDTAIALDLTKRKIICKNQPPIDFDYLSLDIGSTPKLDNIAGSEYVIPAKPIPPLLTGWENLLTNMQQHPQQRLRIVIVGGGAGGVELALNMQTRLHNFLKQAEQSLDHLSINLIQRAPRLLPDYNAWVGKQLERVLQRRGINIRYLESIQAITKTVNNDYQLSCQSGLQFSAEVIFWVTQAIATPWLAQSGLQTDERGFVLVAPTLESISHPRIFAAGDVATVRNYPRPKAGVFAVRQGLPLFENLCRSLQGKALKAYLPQKYYLSLIGTGDQNAIATWGNLVGQHPLFWQWKDHIDRAFMAQFQNLKIV